MTDDLKAAFEDAANTVRELPERPGGDDLLDLYAHFKQATVGDVDGKRPGYTDFVGRAKYDAWAKVQGLSGQDAMQHYIDKVESLKAGI